MSEDTLKPANTLEDTKENQGDKITNDLNSGNNLDNETSHLNPISPKDEIHSNLEEKNLEKPEKHESNLNIDDEIQPCTSKKSNDEDSKNSDKSIPKEVTLDSSKQKEKSEKLYSIKWIEFKDEELPIILQNENGPCPLISIFNVLLLRKCILFKKNREFILENELIQYLADSLFNNYIPRWKEYNKDRNNSELESNYLYLEKNIDDALILFDKLQYGLDVNVKFSGVHDFEYTNEMNIFDLFEINLYHGWVIDPEQKELLSTIKNKSYNQLVEKLIELKSKPGNDLELNILESFLESTASQLTYYGLAELYSTVRPNELCILFRNNHFSTVYKNPKNNKLYLLVTDNGYLNHSSIIWESLDNIEGDSCYFDSEFYLYEKYIVDSKNAQPSGITSKQSDNDYLLALQLSQQSYEAQEIQGLDSAESRKQTQQNDMQRKESLHNDYPRSSNTSEKIRKDSTKSKKPKSPKEDKSCIIL